MGVAAPQRCGCGRVRHGILVGRLQPPVRIRALRATARDEAQRTNGRPAAGAGRADGGSDGESDIPGRLSAGVNGYAPRQRLSEALPVTARVSRALRALVIRRIPEGSRARLSSRRYWRGVGLSLLELLGGVLTWRGLWDLGDIFIVSRVEEELTQTCLGIAVIVSVGVLNVILVGRDEEADKEARKREREREMQERDRADALGSWDNVPRGVAEDLPAQATLTVRPSMGTAETVEEALALMAEEPMVEASLSQQARRDRESEAASFAGPPSDSDEPPGAFSMPSPGSPGSGPSNAAWRFSFLSDSIAEMDQVRAQVQQPDTRAEREAEEAPARAAPGSVRREWLWRPFRAFQDLDSLGNAKRRGRRGVTPAPEGAGTGRAVGGETSESEGAMSAGGRGKGREREQPVRFVWERIPSRDQRIRARGFFQLLSLRRSVRFFSHDPVHYSVLEDCIRAAATAPSGMHAQPWTFLVVQDAGIKRQLREAVEAKERENGERRVAARAKRATPLIQALQRPESEDVSKPYLEEAPYVVVVMEHRWKRRWPGQPLDAPQEPVLHATKSVGVAVGVLTAALHNANLATVVTTPDGCDEQIRTLLNRPDNERVFAIMPVGYPRDDCTVPYRTGTSLRKALPDIIRVF